MQNDHGAGRDNAQPIQMFRGRRGMLQGRRFPDWRCFKEMRLEQLRIVVQA
jgi:hypothetical protein